MPDQKRRAKLNMMTMPCFLENVTDAKSVQNSYSVASSSSNHKPPLMTVSNDSHATDTKSQRQFRLDSHHPHTFELDICALWWNFSMVSSTANATPLARHATLIAVVMMFATLSGVSGAFMSPQIHTQLESTTESVVTSSVHSPPRSKETGLRMSIFDDVGKFLQDMGAQDNGEDSDDEKGGDEEIAGATRLLTIPAKEVKPGGLRLLLMFYLMGQQNTPEPQSWKADQPTRDEYVVDMYYHDRTAVLTVKLSKNQITIDRIGSAPSMSYLAQESVIVDGILDELQVCVTQDDINDEDRLLLLPEPQDAIEKARESLAFM